MMVVVGSLESENEGMEEREREGLKGRKRERDERGKRGGRGLSRAMVGVHGSDWAALCEGEMRGNSIPLLSLFHRLATVAIRINFNFF